MKLFDLPVNYWHTTPSDRRLVRLQYVAIQEGFCYWCHQPLDGPPSAEVQALKIDWWRFPAGFRAHPVHLQHDHETGATEGAVHMLCNAVMWQYHGR